MDLGITIDDVYMLLLVLVGIHLIFLGYIAGKMK